MPIVCHTRKSTAGVFDRGDRAKMVASQDFYNDKLRGVEQAEGLAICCPAGVSVPAYSCSRGHDCHCWSIIIVKCRSRMRVGTLWCSSSSCPRSIKSILPRIYPWHHVHDVTYQALLPLFLRATLKSWESGPGDEANFPPQRCIKYII